ncbi:MAG TPA: hypothetical protein VF132_00700, partial [Rudaea sp.]
VDGGRAYLASWGFGVIIADLSDPAHPSELGRFEFPFVGTIQARGNRVYAGSGTNGGIFAILDVSDPADPQLLGGINTDKTMSLVVRGDLAFLADEDAFGTGGGLRIVDVSDPTAPIVTALDSTDCNYAGGIDASADGRIVYLACEDGTLKIFDASDKSNPALIGSVFLPGSPNLPDYNVAHAVAVDGGTAFVGTESGVDEVDVSDPHAPTVKAHHETGTAVYRVVRADDSRIYAFAGQAGTFVFSNDKIFASGFEAAP